MKHSTASLFLLAVLTPLAPACAGTLDVTNNSQVTLGTNDELIFYLSADYSTCGKSAYPGAIEMLLGGMPLGGPVASIPGTSGVYITGILFNGVLESPTGSASLPLSDPNAARLGLPTGDMLLTPGSRSGGSYSGPIDLLSAEVAIGSQQDAALFASGEVAIELQNTGAPITFGYPGATISSDFTASLISPDGSQSTGAHILDVQCVRQNAPEPGTTGLLILGLTIVARRISKR